METNEIIKSYKGFDKDLKCRGFQYELGKDYELEGDINVCNRGFHACENPIDVLEYYPPTNGNGDLNRYCEVEQSGNTSKDNEDTKIASSKLHIGVEIGLKGLIEAGVKFILDKVDWKNPKNTNTGNYSAATNTGDRSAATNTGNYSAATNTGYYSAASVSGKESVAIITGKDGKAKGALGCWLVLTERDEWNGETYPIKEVKAVKVDGEAIKADVWYKLIGGNIIEAE